MSHGGARVCTDCAGIPAAVERLKPPVRPAAITEYERYISIPAAEAGMTETDWIVHKTMAHAYREAARATRKAEAEAA